MQPIVLDWHLYRKFVYNLNILMMKFLMSKLNKTSFLIVLFLSVTFFSADVIAVKASDDPFLTKSFNLSSGELFVSTSGGSIRVEGSNSSKVTVEMFVKSSRHSDKKIREILEEDYEIRIEKSGSRIEAVAKREGSSWSWNGISISFVVYTPKDFACELKTSGGSLKISGVSGRSHELKTSGGSITAEDMSGNLEARTSGGSININDYVGELDVKTSGGSIKLEDIKGDIEAITSGGGIRLNDVQGEVYASTSGGGINADITRLESQLILKTSGGSVRATIPSGLGLDLDLRGNRVNTSLHNFSGESKSNRVKGTVNGGGILVELSTSGGSVSLDYQ